MSDTSKLTKKQKKALEFKRNKPKDEREAEKVLKGEKRSHEEDEKLVDEKKESKDEAEQSKKKRKTRRGKKGKGVNGGKGPRFLIFVGNLPYDIQEAELVAHFKKSNPDRIRIRQEKGIAFLEFDNDSSEIQSTMEHALVMHHSVLRGRKINVELTVGGGGNSEVRVQKLKEKNEKLYKERVQRTRAKDSKKRSEKTDGEPTGGIHPSRAALIS